MSDRHTIYFVQQVPDGPIKIGRSWNVKRRMASLLNASAHELVLLGVIESSQDVTERILHERFSRVRIRREWFSPDRELLEFIREYAHPLDGSTVKPISDDSSRSAVRRLFPIDECSFPRAGASSTSQVRCPECGFEYVHISKPEWFDSTDYTAPWPGRGDLIRVPMICENGHEWRVCIGFHKGETFLFIENAEDLES